MIQWTRPPTHRVLACRSMEWHYLMAFIEINANSSGQCRSHLSCDLLWGISSVTRRRAATTMMKRTSLNTKCHQSRTFARVCDFRLLVNLLWNTELLVTSIPKVRGGQIRLTCKGYGAFWNVSEQPDTHTSYICRLEALDTHLSKIKWYLLYSSEIIKPLCVWVLYTVHTNTWVLHMAESLYVSCDCPKPVRLCGSLHSNPRW